MPDPPRRVWRDWVVAGGFVLAAVLEMTLSDSAGWKPGAIATSFVLAGALFWRRTEPLKTTVVVFAAMIGLGIISRLVTGEPLEFYSAAIVLILPYALVRWGSGREALIGIGVMLVSFVYFNIADWTGVGDAVGGLFVMLFPAALGDIVRNQHRSRQRLLDEAKLREREQLARELHDTVAHHVSAIAIQAQAGRAVAATRPDTAVETLAIIEEEASRTLAEMRSMVSSLRSGEPAELAPQAMSDDIERLAAATPKLPVVVERSGQLGGLSPTVDRALFRLAQESITNAIRHARDATGVVVSLHGETDVVRLTVADDGAPSADSASHSGFGLVGMAERAALLGGTLTAGPAPDRGWRVEAVLPRNRPTR